MSLLLERQWTRQPQDIPQIDRAFAAARGMTGAFVAGTRVDLVAGGPINTVTGSPTDGSSPWGKVLSTRGSQASIYRIATTDQVAAAQASLVWVGTLFDSPTASANIAGITHNSTNASPFVYLELKRTSSAVIRVTWNGGGAVNALDSGFDTTGGGHFVVVASAASGFQSISVRRLGGGYRVTTATNAGALSAGTNPRWEIGDSLNARNPEAQTAAFFTFNRVFSEAESLSLLLNPWQLLAPQRVIIPLSVGGGVSGTSATTNAADTSSASGTTTVTGTSARTNANDTSSASGTTTVVGTSATTNAADTSSASGTTTVTGTSATTNANDASSASGSVGSGTSGTSATTNANDTGAASGTTTVTGTSARTNANDTAAASGFAGTVTGTVAYTNRNDTANASGSGGAVSSGGWWIPPRRKKRVEEPEPAQAVEAVEQEQPVEAPRVSRAAQRATEQKLAELIRQQSRAKTAKRIAEIQRQIRQIEEDEELTFLLALA